MQTGHAAVCFIFIVLWINPGCHSLLASKLLLPYYSTFQVNYTLYTKDGCYKWKSLNPGVASVHPNYEGDIECSSSATVYAESREPYRRTTLLLAESEITGIILQCDVIVDQIYAIDIISRTRELYLDDPPETLQVRALDEEGNTFSSTAGLCFDWILVQDDDSSDESDEPVPAHNVLRIMRFIDSLYNAKPYVEQLEREGRKSDTILVTGKQTGTAYVHVSMGAARVTQPKHHSQVKLTVRDKVLLNPSGDVFIAKHQTLKYHVEQWREGRPTRVKMPHPQYFLQLCDEGVPNLIVQLDLDTSVVTGLQHGMTKMNLMDKNLKSQNIQASSDIHVTPPMYLKFHIQPLDRTVLEVNRIYAITIFMMDQNNHQMWLSDNMRVQAFIPRSHFEILDASQNGTWFQVRALAKGNIKLHAKLLGFVCEEDGELIKATDNVEGKRVVEVFDRIVVKPPLVIFPWHLKAVVYKYQLTAEGGSGNYTWTINNTGMTITPNSGIVSVKIGPDTRFEQTTGAGTVKAADARNQAHWETMQVMIVPVSEISFSDSPREIVVGEVLTLYIAMYAKTPNGFMHVKDCRNVDVVWSVTDGKVFEEVHDCKENPAYNREACMSRCFRATAEGSTVVKVSYVQSVPFNSGGRATHLSASAPVAAYRPLEALDPDSLAVVTLDSTKTLRFVGGPARWALCQSGYERTVHSSIEDLLELSQVTALKQEHHAIAKCTKLGIGEVILTIGNKQCNSNPFPVRSTISVRISCAVPAGIEISAPAMLPSCPLRNSHSIQTVAISNHQFVVNVTAFDVGNNIFDNFSSIHLRWETNFDDARFESATNFFVLADSHEQRKHKVQQRITVGERVGEMKIQLTMPQYYDQMNSLTCYARSCLVLDPVVEAGVTVLVMSEPYLVPSTLHLYNHNNYTGVMSAAGGSGHFHHQVEQNRPVLKFDRSEDNVVTVRPVSEGKSVVRFSDLCQSATAVGQVVVAQVGKIVVQAPSRIEVNKWGTASMDLYDTDGREMPVRFREFITVTLNTQPSDIVVTGGFLSVSDTWLSLESELIAKTVGATALIATVTTREGHTVSSNLIRVNVFPPLELWPPVVDLIRHSSFQFIVRGGPRSDHTHEFLVLDSPDSYRVANVTQSGLVHALEVGEVEVGVRAVMNDGTVFHCKVPVVVRVVQLAGVRIHAPLTRFRAGATIPLHLSSASHEQRGPFTYGNAFPGLKFAWTTSNPSVVSLDSVHQHAGIDADEKVRFSMVAVGLQAGHSTISVHVTSQDTSLKQLTMFELTAEIALTVFDPLTVVSRNSKMWNSNNNLLVSPSSSYRLRSNRDGVAEELHYQVLPEAPCLAPSDGKAAGNTCVTVDKKGVLTSGSSQCEASLLVTAVERFGTNQTLAMHVMVRPVTYVVARSLTKFRVRGSSTVTTFPMRATLRFTVDRFDDSGNVFDASSADIDFLPNRVDLVQIDPVAATREFHVQCTMTGLTVISVAPSEPEPATSPPANAFYFPVMVKPGVRPHKPTMALGLRICFTSDFVNMDGSDGLWTSSNQGTLLVVARSGVAVATHDTDADLTYTVDTFTARIHVDVVPFSASFDRMRVPDMITRVKKLHAFPIHIHNQHLSYSPDDCEGLEEEMDRLAHQLFSCSVSPLTDDPNLEQLFVARPRYLSELSTYACVVECVASPQQVEDPRMAVVDDVRFMVGLSSRRGGDVTDGSITVPFHPRFCSKLTSDFIGPYQDAILCLVTTAHLHEYIEVTSDAPDHILIQASGYDSDTAENNFCYRVSLRGGQHSPSTPHTVTITAYSTLTNQKRVYNLTVERSSESAVNICNTMGHGAVTADTPHIYIYTVLAAIVSTSLLLTALGLCRCICRNDESNDQTVNPMAASLHNRTPTSPTYFEHTPNRSVSQSPKVRLWSRYYEPQQASPRTG